MKRSGRLVTGAAAPPAGAAAGAPGNSVGGGAPGAGGVALCPATGAVGAGGGRLRRREQHLPDEEDADAQADGEDDTLFH
jgi:hypothetical protein